MEPENRGGPAVAHMEGGEIVPDTPDLSAGTVKFDPEKLAEAISAAKAAVESLGPAWEQLAKATDTMLRRYEWAQAIRWAEAYNPKLVHFFCHTKKKRIRKKYAKRILTWYREKVCGCYD